MSFNRKMRKQMAKTAVTFWRLIPMFQTEDGKLVDGTYTYVIHTELKDLCIAVLPKGTMSLEYAKAKEEELMKTTKVDWIVTSSNIKYFRIEPVPYAEVVKLFPKGIPKRGESVIVPNAA